MLGPTTPCASGDREQAPAFQSHHLLLPLLPLLLPDCSPDPSGRLCERRHGADGVGPLPGPSFPRADVGPGGIQDGFRGGGSGIGRDGQGYVEAVPLVPLPSHLVQHVRITQPPLRGGQRIGWLLPVRLGLLCPRPVYEGEPLDGIHELAQLGPCHARIRHDPAQVIGLEVEGRGVLEEPVLGGHLVLLVLAQVLEVGEAAVALGRVGVGTTRLVEHPPGLDPHLVHVREKVEEQGVHVRRGQGDSPYDQGRDEGADEPGVWAGVEGVGGGGRGGVRVGEGGGGEDPTDGGDAFRLHPLQLLHTSHMSRMYI